MKRVSFLLLSVSSTCFPFSFQFLFSVFPKEIFFNSIIFHLNQFSTWKNGSFFHYFYCIHLSSEKCGFVLLQQIYFSLLYGARHVVTLRVHFESFNKYSVLLLPLSNKFKFFSDILLLLPTWRCHDGYKCIYQAFKRCNDRIAKSSKEKRRCHAHKIPTKSALNMRNEPKWRISRRDNNSKPFNTKKTICKIHDNDDVFVCAKKMPFFEVKFFIRIPQGSKELTFFSVISTFALWIIIQCYTFGCVSAFHFVKSITYHEGESSGLFLLFYVSSLKFQVKDILI